MPVDCLHIMLIAIEATGDYQHFWDSCTAKTKIKQNPLMQKEQQEFDYMKSDSDHFLK